MRIHVVYDVERTPPDPLGSYLSEHEAETCAENLRRAGGDIVVRELEVVTSEQARAHEELWADVQRAGERAGCLREGAYATVAALADELIEARGTQGLHVSPLLAGLINGSASHVGAVPCERLDDDPEYVRGYALGRGDVEARLAMARPVAQDLDELPPGGHVLRRESSMGIVPDPWPCAAVRALYTPAQWAGLQSSSERNADGDGDA